MPRHRNVAASASRRGPEHLHGSLLRGARGEVPPNVALMQLLIDAREPGEVERAITAAVEQFSYDGDTAGAERLRHIAHLWRSTPDAFRTVKQIVSAIDHRAPAAPDAEGVALWASMFDRAARLSPEASVALYSLGRADLLAAATAEIVAGLRAWGVLRAGQSILEIGCGIGRFIQAVADGARIVVGIDVSAEALKIARRRCEGAANALIVRSSGRDLALFADRSFDLVLAVDVFPYLVQSGLAAAHVRDAARVLAPGGTLVLLNYSYRGDVAADCREIAGLAADAGFIVHRNGTRDFTSWDGLAFQLERAW